LPSTSAEVISFLRQVSVFVAAVAVGEAPDPPAVVEAWMADAVGPTLTPGAGVVLVWPRTHRGRRVAWPAAGSASREPAARSAPTARRFDSLIRVRLVWSEAGAVCDLGFCA